MTSRDAFLGAVRDQLRRGADHDPLRPVDPITTPLPPVRWSVDLSDGVGAFVTAATAAGSEVVDARQPDALDGLVQRLRDEGMRTAVVSRDPEVGDVLDALARAGIEVDDRAGADAAAAADLGVTGASHGLALTGSLVVDSRRAGTRLASLLPPVHLAVLDRSHIIPDLGALLRGLGDGRDASLPSNLVCITGHSRSADIELELTPGVHGPRRVLILLS